MGAVDGGIPFAVWHASLSRAWLAYFSYVYDSYMRLFDAG